MVEAVVVEAVRTPVGRRNGRLSGIHPVDLSAHVLQALVRRTGIDPGAVDDVIWGCVNQVGDQSANVGRSAALAAGWPETVPGTTINRACGSSQQAIDFAFAMVRSGMYDTVVAGGVESMSRVPLGAGRDVGQVYGPKLLARYADALDGGIFNQGRGAELIAKAWGLDRRAVDEFSAASHHRAAAATDAGAFSGQLVEVPDAPGFTTDEGIRPGTTADVLAGLTPSFHEDGVIHAGNASQISDGAAALLITSTDRADQLGLRPIVRHHSSAVTGDDPVMMLTGPIPATADVLARSGLSIDDIGAFEVNEAFAPVPLAWLAETKADPERVNPLGGAIALGHPLGASGAILMTRLAHHMRDRDIRYGLQTMCEGGGMANATVLELVA